MHRLLWAGICTFCLSSANAQSADNAKQASNWRVDYAATNLSFQRNAGQADVGTQFLTNTSSYDLKLDSIGARFEFSSGVLKKELAGANPRASIEGEDLLPGQVKTATFESVTRMGLGRMYVS